MNATRVAELIEQTSERLCRNHYEMNPGDTWFHGGSDHNDDRLTATVRDDLTVEVTDGNQTETYDGPMEDAPVRAFVRDWLSDVWANA